MRERQESSRDNAVFNNVRLDERRYNVQYNHTGI